MQAQNINLRVGALTFSNPMWNTWKTASKANDTSAYLLDILGNKTKIRAVFSNSGTLFDNLAGYLLGKGIYPDTVLREGMYQNAGTACNLSLIGLDSATTYSVHIFASRNRTDAQGDTVRALGTAVRFLADTNATRTATFNGVITKTGTLTFAVSAIAQYMYVNAVQISGVPNQSKAVGKITIDSNAINYPNSVVHLTAIHSTGVLDSVYSWSQVSGPWKAIFTAIGDSMYISGLRPGSYQFRLTVEDSSFVSDSTFTTVVVSGPAPCPTCPTCPTCPKQRSVVDLSFDYVSKKWTITYDDGSLQTL